MNKIYYHWIAELNRSAVTTKSAVTNACAKW